MTAQAHTAGPGWRPQGPVEATLSDGTTAAYVDIDAALAWERLEWRKRPGNLQIVAVRALVPQTGEQPPRKHQPECWGRTSYSDEMAHCYCPNPIAKVTGEAGQ